MSQWEGLSSSSSPALQKLLSVVLPVYVKGIQADKEREVVMAVLETLGKLLKTCQQEALREPGRLGELCRVIREVLEKKVSARGGGEEGPRGTSSSMLGLLCSRTLSASPTSLCLVRPPGHLGMGGGLLSPDFGVLGGALGWGNLCVPPWGQQSTGKTQPAGCCWAAGLGWLWQMPAFACSAVPPPLPRPPARALTWTRTARTTTTKR